MSAEPPRKPRAQWRRPLTPEERAAELAHEESLIARDIRRAVAFTLLGCVFWLVVGLGLMGWALHTTDPDSGQIAFLGGLILGYSGVVVTVARSYLRGQDAGWW